MTTHESENWLQLGERILALLDEGNFVATYKYAVLLGLMDLCIERRGHDGAPPASISTRELAEKVVELYWPQILPFKPVPTGGPPRQNTNGQAEILTLILRFR